MPLTFAHPAIVLPFSQKSKYVNFSAMILGSMAPDFEYFLRGQPAGEIGHTFLGFAIFNLPLVVILYLLYHTYIHRTLCSHMPAFLQADFPDKPASSKVMKGVVFVYSAFFGMFTHIFWDAFTHAGGLMVRNLPFLTYTFQIDEYNVPLFKLLQHGSTLVGMIVIIGFMYYRAAGNDRNERENAERKQKRMYWICIGVLAILLFWLWYGVTKVPITAYGIVVVRIIDVTFLSLLLVTLYFRWLSRGKTVDGKPAR